MLYRLDGRSGAKYRVEARTMGMHSRPSSLPSLLLGVLCLEGVVLRAPALLDQRSPEFAWCLDEQGIPSSPEEMRPREIPRVAVGAEDGAPWDILRAFTRGMSDHDASPPCPVVLTGPLVTQAFPKASWSLDKVLDTVVAGGGGAAEGGKLSTRATRVMDVWTHFALE